MELRIIRIENNVVTCQLDNESYIDIARRWFDADIKPDDIIEFDVEETHKKHT